MEKIEGIVVLERAHGETSKIINILTKEYGVIGVIAKGARTMKSDFRTTTTKLTYGYFDMIYKEGKLSVLAATDVITNFKNIRNNIVSISYASYLLDLAEQVSKQYTSPQIFSNLIDALKKIDEGFDPIVITSIVELKYLEYLGVMPIFDKCAVCGSKFNIVTASSTRGGYICKECLTKERILNEKTMKLLRMLYYVDISKITKLEVGLDVKRELHTFLDEYYDAYTGIYLKSKIMLKELNKICS